MDLPKIYFTGTHAARKTHRCCECSGWIMKGDSYHLFKGVWDDGWSTYRTCQECQQLREDLCGEWPPFGELCESVFESEDTSIITRFMETRRNRGAPPSPGLWMEEKEASLKNQLETP